MSIKPIVFNTDMVRAILDGKKTVTRRVVKGLPLCEPHATVEGGRLLIEDDAGDFHPAEEYYHIHPGDIIWVRETWYKGAGRYMYRADYSDSENFYRDGREVRIRWHPSIHMPREAARLFLRVTDVRVERLKEITVEDLQEEGIVPKGYLSQYTIMTESKIWFGKWKELWDSTIKPADRDKYGWDKNPWVWVISFERYERPENWT